MYIVDLLRLNSLSLFTYLAKKPDSYMNWTADRGKMPALYLFLAS